MGITAIARRVAAFLTNTPRIRAAGKRATATITKVSQPSRQLVAEPRHELPDRYSADRLPGTPARPGTPVFRDRAASPPAPRSADGATRLPTRRPPAPRHERPLPLLPPPLPGRVRR